MRIIGKKINSVLYIHKSAIDTLNEAEKDVFLQAHKILDKSFHYEILKINVPNNEVSFIHSPNWNESDEPFVGDSYKVSLNNENATFRKARKGNPQIYHHKWMFVKDDYEGFSVEKSKKRSKQWSELDIEINKKKIGNWEYWSSVVLPKLNNQTQELPLWERGVCFNEAVSMYPGLFNGTLDKKNNHYKPHPTQVKNTVKTYEKIYHFLIDKHFEGKILDASSGEGLGTILGRKMGFVVEDVEPYPPKDYEPMYHTYKDIQTKYDVVISNMVLNILTKDIRNELIEKIFSLLKPNGKAYFIVRGKKDIEKQKTGKPFLVNSNGKDVNCEYYFPNKKSFQKGFEKNELKDYISGLLLSKGLKFEIELATKSNSGLSNSIGVILIKKSD